MSSGITLGDGITSGADGLEDEEEQHADARRNEKDPSSDALDEGGGGDSPRKVPNLENTVDKELGRRIGDTDSLEHLVEVVGDEAISRPLGKPSESDDNRQTFTVTGGVYQGHPADGGSDCPVEIDGGLDFFVLEPNERVVLVSIGVVISQDMESLGVPTLAHQPTRRFWPKPKETKLENRWKSLKSGWDPPRPGRVDLEGTEGTPSGNDGTGVPEGVVEGS